jgi:hypothetical protein
VVFDSDPRAEAAETRAKAAAVQRARDINVDAIDKALRSGELSNHEAMFYDPVRSCRRLTSRIA